MFTYLVDIYSIDGFIVGHALWTVNLLSIRTTEDCMYIRNQLYIEPEVCLVVIAENDRSESCISQLR